MLYMHSLWVIFIVVLSCMLDIVHVGFLEISYHISPITFKFMEAYTVEHLSNILGSELECISKKGGMCGIKVSFLNLVGFLD